MCREVCTIHQNCKSVTLHESYLIKAAKTILTYTGPQGEQQGKKNASSLSDAKRTSKLAMRHFQTANDLKFI